MSRYKTLYKNTLIFTISNFASKLLGFFMLPLYTRVLSREEFGTADLIVLTVGLLLPLLTLSISEGALRFALDEKEDKKQVFSFGLKLIFIGYLILLFFLPFSDKIPVIKEYTVLFYLIYISQSLNLYFNQFTRGVNKIKLIGIVGVIQTLVTVVSNILLLVVFKFGVEGFLLSIVFANTSALIILFFGASLKRYFTFEPVDKQFKKEMLKYCIPLVPNRASWWLNSSANKFIISGYAGVSELGLFSAASRIPSILITFQGIFIQAWQLSAITEYKKDNSVDFFSQIYKLYNFTMLMGCSLLILFIKPISNFMFGAEFSEAWKFVPFLLVAVIFGALIGFLNSINLAVKKTKSLFIAVLIGASLGIILNFLFVPKYGAMAASIATTISFFTIWLIRLIETRKYMRLEINLLRDSLSYILIVFESLSIIFINSTISYYIATVCVVIIVFINKEHISELIVLAKSFFKSKN
jgi:O-antigen/teichoic acid export membrane protein